MSGGGAARGGGGSRVDWSALAASAYQSNPRLELAILRAAQVEGLVQVQPWPRGG